MDIKSGREYPAGALSNFQPREFTFRGVKCASMEGLLQSLKFKGPEMQVEVCKLTGLAAKKRGANKNWQESQTLWWQGEPIKRDSKEYQQLLDEAFDALFKQNDKAGKALLDTGDVVLTHNIGKRKENETILTRSEFCGRLTRIREELRKAKK
jgi:predicted NAD-dependent protein-ADP-ribosyltransferase YbiA (DUF1768 family)